MSMNTTDPGPCHSNKARENWMDAVPIYSLPLQTSSKNKGRLTNKFGRLKGDGSRGLRLGSSFIDPWLIHPGGGLESATLSPVHWRGGEGSG